VGAPLNPVLYARLKRYFGSVRISQQGIGQRHKRRMSADGEKRLDFVPDGEYYSVSCPICGDTRHRLFINHMFGKRDAFGRRMTFLAFCFNEDCMRRYEHRQELLDILEGDSLAEVDVKAGADVAVLKVAKLPGVCTPLAALKEDHPAKEYLADRGFDPDQLSRKFGVMYCSHSHFFLARNRIIIPVTDGAGVLRGWQARHVGDLDWHDKKLKKDLPPKYFSCPGSNFRSLCIYNWARMKLWSTGILCEGPTDVWRFGAMAGCIFGNTVTPSQREKVRAVFRKRSLVLLLDPEEYDKEATVEVRRWFKDRLGKAFCAVKLPDGTDPGSLEQSFLRAYVREQAAKLGVDVVYKKWRG
jgi:hypothetical protein